MKRIYEKNVLNALQYSKNCSGIGVMIRELFVPFMSISDVPCLVAVPNDYGNFPVSGDSKRIVMPYRHSQHLRRMWFQSVILSRKYCRNSTLLITDSKTPFFLPKSCRLIPLVTDLALYRMPKVYSFSRVIWWRLQYQYILKKAIFFVAISEFTKKDLMEIFNIPEEKIFVVPCAIASDYRKICDAEKIGALRKKYHLPQNYILFVGNNNPRKNLVRIIQAFDKAKSEGLTQSLVIAGGQGWKFDRDAALSGVEHKNDVCFTGFVADEDMPVLYSAADLFVFPTLYEGFGIPILEAQACGTPVLTSNCSSMPEVGGDAARYVDPYDIEDMKNGMVQILTDEEYKNQLVKKGYKNIKRFSWEKSAERLNDILKVE